MGNVKSLLVPEAFGSVLIISILGGSVNSFVPFIVCVISVNKTLLDNAESGIPAILFCVPEMVLFVKVSRTSFKSVPFN